MAALATAFILSILSSLDCVFLKADVGFVPMNMNRDTMGRKSFGLGIWSIEDPENEGFCIVPIFQGSEEDDRDLTKDDNIYSSFLVAEDDAITIVRFMVLFGLLIGVAHVVSRFLFPFIDVEYVDTPY